MSAPRPFVLNAAVAVHYASGGAFLPFITLLFQDRGLDLEQISHINLLAAAVGATVPLLWGVVADRWVATDRLLFVLYVAFAIAFEVFAWQQSFQGLLLGYVLLFALYPPAGALLFALAYRHFDAPERQFSRLRSWGSVGWIAPSFPIFLWLAFRGEGKDADLTFTLHAAAAINVLQCLLVCLLPHTPPLARAKPGDGELGYRAAVVQLFRKRGFVGLMGVVVLLHSSFAILFYYSPKFLEERGIDRTWIGPIQSGGVACEVLLFLTLPWALRRLGLRGTLLVGCATMMLRHLLYALDAPPWALAASYVLAGMVVVYYVTVSSIVVNSLASSGLKATAQTLLMLLGSGIGQTCGHWAAGRIALHSTYGLRGVFVYATVSAAAAFALLAFVMRERDFAGTGSSSATLLKPPAAPPPISRTAGSP